MPKKRLSILLAVGLVLVVFLIWLFWSPHQVGPNINWGITFSPKQAKHLGLDWRQTYQAILDDLKVRHLRLAADWDQIEPQENIFDFTDLDYQLNEAQKRGAKIILAVGRKLPRWPECHIPTWAQNLSDQEQQAKVLKMLQEVVQHARPNLNIIAWQVENEPLLSSFGICPPHPLNFLKQEVSLVKSLDSRPIIITESGELSTWLRSVGPADILGISLYRSVFNERWGTLTYPLTPTFYKRHASLVRSQVDDVIVTELQGEPWGKKPIPELTSQEQLNLFDSKKLDQNINFVKATGFSQIYLWGAEYWYYRRLGDDETLWNRARQLFHLGL